MNKFEILRYFKKWRFLIAGLSIAAGVFFFIYAKDQQVYTAQSVIRYAFPEAESGYAPDGSELDVTEIFSSAVVKKTLEELDVDTQVEEVRSKGSVTEIIPENVQRSIDAKIDEGNDYEEYQPIDYSVKFKADSDEGAEYARVILDAVLSNYFVVFGEKYLNQTSIPNNAANALNQEYDFIERAEIINNSLEDILQQISYKETQSPNFNSARSGLTFTDLYDQYNYISQVKVPYLFSEILGNKLTDNKDVLIKKYKERIENYNLSNQTDADKIQAVLEIIKNYGEKNKEGALYYHKQSVDNDKELNGNILDHIYEDAGYYGGVVDRTTVYDQLLSDYVSLEMHKAHAIIDAAYCQYIIDIFSTVDMDKVDNESVRQLVEADIESIVTELNELYEKLSITMEEYNEYLGAKNLRVLSSTSVSESINVKLYMALGISLFFVLGCLGAIVLGRLQDFAEYFFYTDTKLQMYNRSACDSMISRYAERVLPGSFSCVVVELSNLNAVNAKSGREQGDRMLINFSKFVKEAFGKNGFLAYNGGFQFIGFMEKCPYEELSDRMDYMIRLVKNYNEENSDCMMEMVVGISESNYNNVYSIRSLLQKALKERQSQEV